MSFDWGSVIGAAVSLYGAKKGADAAKSAGQQATQAQATSDALQRYIYDDQRALSMPGYQAGLVGLQRLMHMLGLGGIPAYGQAQQASQGTPSGTTAQQSPYSSHANVGQMPSLPAAQAPQAAPSDPYAQFRSTPGYQFGLDEGLKSTEASAAARGGLNSGATLKALMKYGQNYADQRGFDPYMQRLQSLAGLQQTASSQIGNAGQNYANQVGNNAWNGAQARAQSTYGQANAWNQGLQQAWQYGNQAYQSYRNGQ